jgi:uncharacterized membrane protein YgcG
MKRWIVMVFIGLLIGVPAYADQVDDGLPAGTDAALKAHTRAMIQAGVDLGDALDMTRAMLQNRFERGQIIEAQQVVVAARAQGCPAGPVINKAYEGIVKKVPAERIVQAMQRVQQRYAAAYHYAGTLAAGREELRRVGDRLAEGMTAGLDQEDSARIMQQVDMRMRTMTQHQASVDLAVETAATARDLARLGVPSQDTAEMVCQALQHNYQANNMIRLRQQFRDQLGQETPQKLAHRYIRAFQNGQNPASDMQGPGQYGQHGSASMHGAGSDSGGGSMSGGGNSGSGGHGGSGGGGNKR